jgi:hypothetical protein
LSLQKRVKEFKISNIDAKIFTKLWVYSEEPLSIWPTSKRYLRILPRSCSKSCRLLLWTHSTRPSISLKNYENFTPYSARREETTAKLL